MRIYLASSWKNGKYPEVLDALRAAGHEVYDFRNPEDGNTGFSWAEIDPNWESWTASQYQEALHHRLAEKGFGLDMAALEKCEGVVLLLPCGRSAHLEAGYAAGAGKKLFILLDPYMVVPELMYKMADGIASTVDGIVSVIRTLNG